MKPKYPLKPLLEHRQRNVDNATAELGDAIRAREAAERARDAAAAARVDAEERAAAVRTEEATHLDRGELTVADLARADAWSVGAATDIARLAATEAKATAHVDDAAGAETVARSGVAQKMAERDVIVKDEARFLERAQKRVLAAEEEAAEEARRGR